MSRCLFFSLIFLRGSTLAYHLPYPLGCVYFVSVFSTRNIEIAIHRYKHARSPFFLVFFQGYSGHCMRVAIVCDLPIWGMTLQKSHPIVPGR